MQSISASLVYLLLRQILQMRARLARDGGAKDVELLVLRHQWRCFGGRFAAATCNQPTG